MTEKQTVKFGDICREVKLTTKNPIADGYDKYIGLDHLDSCSLKVKRWGRIAEDNPSFTRVFKKGHILFGKRRSYLKKAAIAEFDGVCSGDIIVMEPIGNLMLPELLPFIVQSERFWDFAIKTSSGSLSPRTKFKSLENFEISNKSTDTQRNFLKVLLKCNKIININSEISSSLQQLKGKLLMENLFLQGDVGIRLADVCEVISGQHIQANFYDNDPNGTPYLTGPDDFKNGFIEVTKYTKKPKVMSRSGDVLLTVKGSGVGKTAIAEQDYCISRQLMAIRSKGIPQFMVYILVSALTEKLNKMASGIIPGITKSDVENFKISSIDTIESKSFIQSLSSLIDVEKELSDGQAKTLDLMRKVTHKLTI